MAFIKVLNEKQYIILFLLISIIMFWCKQIFTMKPKHVKIKDYVQFCEKMIYNQAMYHLRLILVARDAIWGSKEYIGEEKNN